MKEITIEKICYVGGCNKDFRYREIYRLETDRKEQTCKIEIATDDSNPSDAKIYVLNGLDWTLLYSIPATVKHTRNNLQYKFSKPNDAINEFNQDITELKTKLVKILNLK